MKKNNKMQSSNNVTNKVKNKSTNKVTNSSNENSIGFDATSNSKSFKYDENADHSFELRDCK